MNKDLIYPRWGGPVASADHSRAGPCECWYVQTVVGGGGAYRFHEPPVLLVQGMIPAMSGLSPLKAADLAHAEAQFLVMRAALRAITDGRNLLLDISMASLCRTGRGIDGPDMAVFSRACGGQRHRLGG
jgi:hypothetical protein